MSLFKFDASLGAGSSADLYYGVIQLSLEKSRCQWYLIGFVVASALGSIDLVMKF